MAATGRKKTGGRKKGTPNKTTRAIKDAILNAFEEVGGENYLVKVAMEDPKTFCSLLAKILPTDMKHGVDEDLVELLNKGRKRAMAASSK
jgi:hypothetical protein